MCNSVDGDMPYSRVGSFHRLDRSAWSKGKTCSKEIRDLTVGTEWGEVGCANSYTWMALAMQPDVRGICWLCKAGSCESALVALLRYSL